MDYNGAQTADNTSDIEKLIEILNEWEFKYKEEKEASKKGVIPPTPKYTDIIKTIGNIGLSIPMGFVMVHNDLTDIYALLLDMYSLKGNSGSSTSWQDVANTALNVAGNSVVAVTAMGLVSKIIDKYSLSEILDGLDRIIEISMDTLPKAASKLTQTLEEIGSGVAATILNISDISTDESIISERKKNSLRYLNAFYSNLFTDLGYEAIFSDDGTEITGIKTYKDERAIDLKEVSNGKISKETAEVAIETVGDAIGEFATAKAKAWVDLFEEEIPQAILIGGESYDFLTDESLISQRKLNALRYLNLFFNSMYNSLGYEAIFSDDGTEITGVKTYKDERAIDLKEASNGKITKETAEVAIDTVGDAIGEFATAVPKAWVDLFEEEIPQAVLVGGESYDFLTDESLISQRKLNALRYLNLFFNSMYNSLGYEAVFNVDGTEITGIKKIEKTWSNEFNSLSDVVDFAIDKGGDAIGELSTAIPKAWIDLFKTNIPELILTNIEDYDFLEDERIQSTISDMTQYYIQAYFVGIIDAMGWDFDLETGKLSKKEQEDKSWWQKNVLELASDGITSIGKSIGNILESIGDWGNEIDFKDTMSATIQELLKSAKDDDSVQDATNSLVTQYINAYFVGILDAMGWDFDLETGKLSEREIEDKSWWQKTVLDWTKDGITSIGESIGDIIESMGDWGNEIDFKDTMSATIQELLKSAKDDDSVQDATNSLVTQYINAYFVGILDAMGWDFDLETGKLSEKEQDEEEKSWWKKTVLDWTKDGITSIGNLIGDTIESMGDWGNEIDFKDTISTTIQELLKNVKDDDSVQDATNNLVTQYLTAYFSSMLNTIGWNFDLETSKLSEKEQDEEKKSWWKKNGLDIAEDTIKWVGDGIESLLDWGNELESKEQLQKIKSNVLTNLSNMTIEKGDLTLTSYYNNISSFATKFSEILLEQINNDRNKTYFQLTTGVLDNEVKDLKKIVLDKFKDSPIDFLTEAFSKSYSNSVQSIVEEAVGNYTIEIKDATQTVSSYNESNLFNKLDDVLTKLTKIVNALTYEDSSNNSISRLSTLNTIDKTLTNGFDDLEFSLDSIEGIVNSLSGSSVNVGNTTVDNMAQM